MNTELINYRRGTTGRRGGTGHSGRCDHLALFILLTVLGFSTVGSGENIRTQTVGLSAGWNAVFLEVYPDDPDPAVVFAGTPIDIAAAFYDAGITAQYVTNPGADLFKESGWGVWYADDRPDAFLKDLYAIYGQQAYLLHSKSNSTWQVTGAVTVPRVVWRPYSYGLVGFSVDPVGPPTFAQFFAGSTQHGHNRIYRLANGAWRQVVHPDNENMRSGEAFWIYCDGTSDYQGPLRVETPTQQGLVLMGSGPVSLILRNSAGHPVTPTLEHVAVGSSPVPLSIVIQVTEGSAAKVGPVAAAMPVGAWTQPLPALEAGEAMRVPLTVRLDAMTSFAQTSIVKISTDLGTEVWIPVTGIREDLEGQ